MNRIRDLRLNSGMKQVDLAKALSISQAALSGYETGKYEPDFETLKKFADYFSVSVDYLLGRDKPASSVVAPVNHFREQRLKHGFKTQKDLADILFVNQTAVSQWERGATTPSSQLLLRLSELYGVTTDYLLGRDESKPSVEQGHEPSKDNLMAAFWGGEEDLSQEDLEDMWNDVERFAAFLADKKRQEKKDD